MDTTATNPSGLAEDSALDPTTGTQNPASNNGELTIEEQEAQLMALLNEVEANRNQAAEAPKQEQPQEPEESQEEEADDADDAKAEESTGKKGKQFRVRAQTPEDEAFYSLLKTGKSPKEAAELLYKQQPKETAPETTRETPAAKETAAPNSVESIQAEISRLTAEAKKASEEYEYGTAAELTAQIAALSADLAMAKVQASAVQASLSERVAEAEEAAYSLYPDAATPGTPMFRLCQKLATAYKAAGNEAMKSSDWPLVIAREAAGILGIAETGEADEQPGSESVSTPRKQAPYKPRPVGSVGRVGAAPPPPPVDINSMGEEELMAYHQKHFVGSGRR